MPRYSSVSCSSRTGPGLRTLVGRETPGTDVPIDRETENEDVWDYLRSPLADVGTWAGLFYLASKFFVASLRLCNFLARLRGWYTRLVIKPRPLV